MLYLYHRKIQRKRTHLHNYKLCEPVKVSYSSHVCCYWTLSSLGVIESPISRVTKITNIRQIRLCFRMKVRFSGTFLYHNRVIQRQRMQNIHVVALDMCEVAFKSSPLRLVSSFWLSGYLFLAMQFISEFIWVNLRRNGLTWQAKTLISYFAINSHWKRRTSHVLTSHVLSTWSAQSANKSVYQDCRFATNRHLRSADLWHRHQLTNKPRQI